MKIHYIFFILFRFALIEMVCVCVCERESNIMWGDYAKLNIARQGVAATDDLTCLIPFCFFRYIFLFHHIFFHHLAALFILN